jgi:hypothetical protein
LSSQTKDQIMKNLIVAALLGCALISSASANVVADVAIINQSTGERLPTYRHQGKLWVAGKPGDRYAIELRNVSGERILTVVSVDGVNVVSGETAAASQRGYVLSPGNTAAIAGWRKSSQEVAAFYFTSLPDSYASRTQRPENVGVIGVAAFREYQEPPPVLQEAPARSRAESAAAPVAPSARAADAAKSENKLGTGHGERLNAPTYTVDFRRARPTPDEIVSIHYDSYSNLVRMGVIPGTRKPPFPRAFPGDSYVPDPS